MRALLISQRLAYGWLDITTNRTVTVASIDQLRAQFNANAWSGRAEGGYRFVVPWVGGIGIAPYAAGQFTTFDLPAYAEQGTIRSNRFALVSAKSVTSQRAWTARRQIIRDADGMLTLRGRVAWAHDFNPDRNVAAAPDAAGRILYRQRSRAGGRLRARDRLSREKMAERLVSCHHLRGRVLQRHCELRRQGSGEVFLVRSRPPFLAANSRRKF